MHNNALHRQVDSHNYACQFPAILVSCTIMLFIIKLIVIIMHVTRQSLIVSILPGHSMFPNNTNISFYLYHCTFICTTQEITQLVHLQRWKLPVRTSNQKCVSAEALPNVHMPLARQNGCHLSNWDHENYCKILKLPQSPEMSLQRRTSSLSGNHLCEDVTHTMVSFLNSKSMMLHFGCEDFTNTRNYMSLTLFLR